VAELWRAPHLTILGPPPLPVVEPVKHEVPDRRQRILTSHRERKEPNAKPAGTGEGRGLDLSGSHMHRSPQQRAAFQLGLSDALARGFLCQPALRSPPARRPVAWVRSVTAVAVAFWCWGTGGVGPVSFPGNARGPPTARHLLLVASGPLRQQEIIGPQSFPCCKCCFISGRPIVRARKSMLGFLLAASFPLG